MENVQTFGVFVDQILEKLPISFSNKYLQSLVLLIFFVLIAKGLMFFVKHFVRKIAAKTKTKADDLIIDVTHRPTFYVLILIGIALAAIPLGLPEKAVTVFSRLIFSLIIILITYMIIAVIGVFIDVFGKEWAKNTESTFDDDLLPLFHKASKIIFFILGFVFVLSVWNVDITGLVAGLGIAGIIIGLAVKDSLSNVFGGISLMLDRTFRAGDKIMLESGELGVVEDVGLRSTRLRTFDNELVIVPNGYLANTRVKNYVLPTKDVRVVVDFGVEYGTPVEKVKKTVLETIKGIEGCLTHPQPVVEFMSMADFALLFKAKFWVSDYSTAYDKCREATEKIYNALNKAKIGIPFPTRTIYMKKS